MVVLGKADVGSLDSGVVLSMDGPEDCDGTLEGVDCIEGRLGGMVDLHHGGSHITLIV